MPERVLGRSSAQMIRLGRANLPIRLADVLADLLRRARRRPRRVALERHERGDRLAGVLVGLADHRGLGDLRVRDDRRLDLGGRQPVAGDVDHVVDAPDDPEVAVLVLARGVADEVDVLAELVPVGLDEAVVLLVERAQHRRPRPAQRRAGPARCRRPRRSSSTTAASMPGSGLPAEPGLVVRAAPGSVVIMMRAGLGLPPGVDDRAALAADHLVVPEPGLRVDRLADRPEQPQRATGRASPGTRRPTSCTRGSRSARCRRSSRS